MITKIRWGNLQVMLRCPAPVLSHHSSMSHRAYNLSQQQSFRVLHEARSGLFAVHNAKHAMNGVEISGRHRLHAKVADKPGLILLSSLRRGNEGPCLHVWQVHFHLWCIKAFRLVTAEETTLCHPVKITTDPDDLKTAVFLFSDLHVSC